MSNSAYHNPTVILAYSTNLGSSPTRIMCPSCQATISTSVRFETAVKTHALAGLLCLFGCWPCVWIPYFVNSCKNANHYCPVCNCFVGSSRGPM